MLFALPEYFWIQVFKYKNVLGYMQKDHEKLNDESCCSAKSLVQIERAQSGNAKNEIVWP